MNISIDELSKDEYREIFMALDISKLRNLIASDNNLVRKHIKGYRPNNTPPHELARIYQLEISSGNDALRDAFIDAIESWSSLLLNDNTSEEILITTVPEAVNMGTILAQKDLKVRFELFARLVSWDLSKEEIQIIGQVYNSLRPLIKEQEEALELMQTQMREAIGNAQASEDKIKRLQESRDKNKNNADSEKRRREELEIENETITGEIQDLNLTIAELKENLREKGEQIQFLKEESKKKDERVKELNSTVASVGAEKNAIIAEKKKLEAQKEFEFDQIIARLVGDTISDLKIDFELSEDEFNELIANIDGPHDIVNIWGNMSKANQGMIEDIEANMKRNVASMEIIDMCDQAENYILVKYIILKAIKAIVFEKMSRKEKQQSISSSFQK